MFGTRFVLTHNGNEPMRKKKFHTAHTVSRQWCPILLLFSIILTDQKEAKCIVILNRVCSVGRGNSEQRRDDSTETTIEEPKSRKDSICVGITEDELPLS